MCVILMPSHEPELSSTQSRRNNDISRCDFLKLPMVERRRILREQAKPLLVTYKNSSDISGMGWGDLVDY